jgi:hypothetical protein
VIRARTALFLAVGLAAPCLVYAQTPTEKKAPAPQMSEDVEVMRRILNRSLHLPRYGSQTVWVPGNGMAGVGNIGGGVPGNGLGGVGNIDGGVHGNPVGGALGIMGGGVYGNPVGGALGIMGGQNVGVSTVEFPAVEGVYLKGHGVIFTVTLPPQQNPKPDAAVSPPEKPLTEWERVRKEVRGEKVVATAKTKKNPSVLDTLLRVLAENGTHLAQLGPDETITIVVTFRESESAKNAGLNPFYKWSLVPNTIDLRNLDPLQFRLGNDPAGDDLVHIIRAATDPETNEKGTQPKEATGGKAKEVPAAVKDNLLLGDLNFKQGKHKEAEKAYLSALKLLESNPDDAALHQVYQALAQTYLADGKTADAMNYIEKALAIEKKASVAAPPKKEATPPSTVPVKLIVSAPKKLLDQVAAEKISLEEFKKQATVEYIPSPAPEK